MKTWNLRGRQWIYINEISFKMVRSISSLHVFIKLQLFCYLNCIDVIGTFSCTPYLCLHITFSIQGICSIFCTWCLLNYFIIFIYMCSQVKCVVKYLLLHIIKKIMFQKMNWNVFFVLFLFLVKDLSTPFYFFFNCTTGNIWYFLIALPVIFNIFNCTTVNI